jgi:hypothetical protein
MENVGKFYGHLVYFMPLGYILWSFGIFPPRFGIIHQEKSGNPDVCIRSFKPPLFSNFRNKNSRSNIFFHSFTSSIPFPDLEFCLFSLPLVYLPFFLANDGQYLRTNAGCEMFCPNNLCSTGAKMTSAALAPRVENTQVVEGQKSIFQWFLC